MAGSKSDYLEARLALSAAVPLDPAADLSPAAALDGIAVAPTLEVALRTVGLARAEERILGLTAEELLAALEA